MLERVHRYKEKTPLFEGTGVDAEIRSTLNRRVDLPSGGYLIFDYAEAFTVVDVNTGRFVGSRSKNSTGRLEDTITKNNLEAVKEVVRQLRLRDIGGIIVIDFIDMANPKNRATVEEALRTELERDRTKTYVVEISPLGLVEMTRQNVTDGPREILTKKCPTCAGDGIVVSEASAALEVERRLRTLAAGSRAQAFQIEVNPKTMSLLLGKGGSRLAEIEEASKKRFFLAPKEGVHADHAAVLAEGKLVDLQPPTPIAEGTEVELKLVEVDKHDAGSAVGKLDGIDVVVGGAAKLVGKKAKVRVERVLDGVAYATRAERRRGAGRADHVRERGREADPRAEPRQEGDRDATSREAEQAEATRARRRGRRDRGDRRSVTRRSSEDEPEDEPEEATEAVADGAEARRRRRRRAAARAAAATGRRSPPARRRRHRARRGAPRRSRSPRRRRPPPAAPRIHVPDFELGDDEAEAGPEADAEAEARRRGAAQRRGGRRRGGRAGRRGGRRGDGRRRGDAAEEEDAPRLARRPQPEEAGSAAAAAARERRRACRRGAGSRRPRPRRTAAIRPRTTTCRCRNGSTTWTPSRYTSRPRGSCPRFSALMSTYAIISVGGKQYRVREGETLLVDRLKHGAGNSFQPKVLLIGGDGDTDLSPSATVTASVVADVKGDKIRIGKYRPKNGYKKHTGFRASLSEIKIESIGGAKKAAAKKTEPAPAKKAETAAKAEAAAPADDHVKGMPSGYEDLTVAADQGAVGRLEPPDARGRARVRAGPRQAQGRDRRDRAALAEKESD